MCVLCLPCWHSKDGKEKMRQQKEHIAVHEGQLLKMSGSKERGRERDREIEREVVFAQAVFLSRRPYSAFLGTWQIDWRTEWNINTPQPLLLPKKLQLESRQGEISVVRVLVRVCVCVCVWLQIKWGCLFGCVSSCPTTLHVCTNEGVEI